MNCIEINHSMQALYETISSSSFDINNFFVHCTTVAGSTRERESMREKLKNHFRKSDQFMWINARFSLLRLRSPSSTSDKNEQAWIINQMYTKSGELIRFSRNKAPRWLATLSSTLVPSSFKIHVCVIFYASKFYLQFKLRPKTVDKSFNYYFNSSLIIHEVSLIHRLMFELRIRVELFARKMFAKCSDMNVWSYFCRRKTQSFLVSVYPLKVSLGLKDTLWYRVFWRFSSSFWCGWLVLCLLCLAKSRYVGNWTMKIFTILTHLEMAHAKCTGHKWLDNSHFYVFHRKQVDFSGAQEPSEHCLRPW